MSHRCDDCEEKFETLTSLRLHDYPEADDEDDWEQEREEHLRQIRKLEREENEAAKRAASTELTDAIEGTETGDDTAVYELLAHYERHLTEVYLYRRQGNSPCV
jgi:hypothetical protein